MNIRSKVTDADQVERLYRLFLSPSIEENSIDSAITKHDEWVVFDKEMTLLAKPVSYDKSLHDKKFMGFYPDLHEQDSLTAFADISEVMFGFEENSHKYGFDVVYSHTNDGKMNIDDEYSADCCSHYLIMKDTVTNEVITMNICEYDIQDDGDLMFFNINFSKPSADLKDLVTLFASTAFNEARRNNLHDQAAESLEALRRSNLISPIEIISQNVALLSRYEQLIYAAGIMGHNRPDDNDESVPLSDSKIQDVKITSYIMDASENNINRFSHDIEMTVNYDDSIYNVTMQTSANEIGSDEIKDRILHVNGKLPTSKDLATLSILNKEITEIVRDNTFRLIRLNQSEGMQSLTRNSVSSPAEVHKP